MATFLRKNLTLRSGVTLERRRVLADAGVYLAAHPVLRECYVTHVHPVADAQAAFTAAIAPRPGQARYGSIESKPMNGLSVTASAR